MAATAAQRNTEDGERPGEARRVEAEPSARLRAAIGKLSRRLRPTVAGSG